MEYKLFDEYITLQALLKELSIIHSGGAIKGFLANNVVLFNGEEEKRRGKKLRYGDVITIPSEELEITIVVPTQSEIEKHKKEVAERARVYAIVKKMNKDNKKKQKKHQTKESNKSYNNIKENKGKENFVKRKEVKNNSYHYFR